MEQEARETKNEVFKSPSHEGAQYQQPRPVSAAERVRADFGMDIPAETVPLPSLGKVYPQGSPLHMRETVDITPMSTREEDILTSRALLKKGTVITELIRSCLVDKSIDPASLVAGDRNALMVAIRVTGYGAAYEAEIECDECNVKAPREFNLADLPIKSLDIDPVRPGENLFEFSLPRCKKVVKFRFLTGRDEEEILALQEKQKKLGISSDAAVTTNLFHSIVSVDGIEDRQKLAGFIRVMPAMDSLALRSYVKDHEPGILMKQEITCASCGHEEVTQIPLGISFFWPHTG